MEPPPIVARELPFARRDVVVEAVRVSVVDDGPRGARETLLFLHGNPAWSFLWRRFLAAGKEASRRVVAPDLAGFGLSDKPRDAAYHTLERHVANLDAVATELDLRDLTLVLHDWGGPIGLGFAVRRPERVKRIVLANTVAFAPKKQRPLSRWHAFMAAPLGQFLGVRANLVARSAFRFGTRVPLPRDVREAYLWPMRDPGGRVAAAALVRMVPDGPLHPAAGTLRAIELGYARLQDKPVLVLWADRDPVMGPKLAERWLQAFPKAEVRHVAPAGHFWQEDAPGAFLPHVLGFVGGRGASRHRPGISGAVVRSGRGAEPRGRAWRSSPPRPG